MRFFAFLFIVLFNLPLYSQSFDHLNIDLLGRWSIPEDKTPEWGSRYSSCWAFAQNGREYAIVGCSGGTAYIDITDPTNPVFIDFVESNIKNAIWREYKTYQHYAYQVSDDGGPNHFDIVDLSYLPDSVHVVYSGSEEYFRTGHTIFIDHDNMYIGLHNHKSMSVFSLKEDPTKPELLRKLSDDYKGDVHDMFVRNDTVYASKGWDGALQILTFKDNKFTEIGNYNNYPFVGYNHSSWLTPDGKTLIFTDEVPENLPAKSLDVTDPSNPVLLDTFYSQTGKATLHNPFEAPNNTFLMSSYLDGVQVFDYSDPTDIKLRGYFDTHYQSQPGNTTGDYDGAWSAYGLLPSKNIVVVDMTNGLFVLDGTKAYYPETNAVKETAFAHKLETYPNPATREFQLKVPDLTNQVAEIKIFDITGKLVYQNIMEGHQLAYHKFRVKYAPGTYIVQLKAGKKIYSAELLVVQP
ncbi:MAG: choice-of-anchor B family protein [Saprospiraceae bacterium]|nr:choice-of-anchor B family protein [Saprospiraceae bacterium]